MLGLRNRAGLRRIPNLMWCNGGASGSPSWHQALQDPQPGPHLRWLQSSLKAAAGKQQKRHQMKAVKKFSARASRAGCWSCSRSPAGHGTHPKRPQNCPSCSGAARRCPPWFQSMRTPVARAGVHSRTRYKNPEFGCCGPSRSFFVLCPTPFVFFSEFQWKISGGGAARLGFLLAGRAHQRNGDGGDNAQAGGWRRRRGTPGNQGGGPGGGGGMGTRGGDVQMWCARLWDVELCAMLWAVQNFWATLQVTP